VLSATPVGMIIGSYLFGVIGDWIGRRPGFQLSILLFAVFSALCALAHNSLELALLRLVTGIGIGGFAATDTVMLSEFMPARTRGRMITLFSLFYPVGGLLAAWLAKIVVPDFGWRAFFVVGVVPAIMVLIVRMLVPESPRFLLNRGRIAEARKAVAWVAAGTDVPDTPAPSGESLDSGVPRDRITLSALFADKYRDRTLMVWAVWFCWCFSYFGTLLWLPSLLVQYRGVPGASVFTFMMGFMFCGILGRVTAALLIDHLGRKLTIAACGVAASCLLFLFGQQSNYTMLMVFGYAFAFFHDGGLSAIAPYAPELYPTRMRSTGVGLANGAGRIAAMLAPIAVGYLVAASLQLVFLVLSAGYLLTSIVIGTFGVETKGLVLEAAALEGGELRPAVAPKQDLASASTI
jgi:putative MFS transporter